MLYYVSVADALCLAGERERAAAAQRDVDAAAEGGGALRARLQASDDIAAQSVARAVAAEEAAAAAQTRAEAALEQAAAAQGRVAAAEEQAALARAAVPAAQARGPARFRLAVSVALCPSF
jgi:SWI/SNF-related matrix-associated actin-dependent regulator 1 of chromatin subfamily A